MNDKYTDTLIHVIPNTQPGWYVAMPTVDEKNIADINGLLETPVVAWRVKTLVTDPDSEGDRGTYDYPADPVTVDDLGNNWALHSPENEYIFPYNLTTDRKGAIEYFKEVAQAKKAAAERRAAKNTPPSKTSAGEPPIALPLKLKSPLGVSV